MTKINKNKARYIHSLLSKVSIRKLTLLGFAFVALPLVIALLFSASKLNVISNQSTQTIFNVANLIQFNRELSDALANLERSASQYLVLKDKDLNALYIKNQNEFNQIVTKKFAIHQDEQLKALVEQLTIGLSDINAQLMDMPTSENSLERLQDKFKQLVAINQKIRKHSNLMINDKAKNIQKSADKVSNNILLSLFTIPVTLLIALIFIYLITKPLRRLIEKIQSLEQGNFEQTIEIQGAPEIVEIADALEVMRKRLHALELQKSRFIRHISHELKTPLAAIREGTELIYDNSVGELNSEQKEICEIIKTSSHRLQTLIEDLLNFNIVLDSTSLQDVQQIQINSLIEKAIDERKLDIKRKHIIIENNTPCITIYGNEKQFSVVLDNLLSNAIKYSEVNGTIYINSKVSNGLLSIAIIDSGTGIAEESLPQIFDAFYQGAAPKDSQIKGSGLGLTIVKELMMRLNGDISIKNNQDNGVCVTLTLPRAKMEPSN